MKKEENVTYEELEKVTDEITEAIIKLVKTNFTHGKLYQVSFNWSLGIMKGAEPVLYYYIMRDGNVFFEDTVYLNYLINKEYSKEFPALVAECINNHIVIEEISTLTKAKQTFLKMIEQLEERLEAGTIDFKKFNENYIEHKKTIKVLNDLLEEVNNI